MWIATWALNTLIAKGKTTDWEVHMLGQSVGARALCKAVIKSLTKRICAPSITQAYNFIYSVKGIKKIENRNFGNGKIIFAVV